MKALSLKQPWLYAITHLGKRVENRTWKPPQSIIGKYIALHASKKDDLLGYTAIAEIAGIEIKGNLPRGAIVATAKVVGFKDFNEVNPFEGAPDDWFFGPVGWLLEDINVLSEPISCRGALGLWDIPQELLPRLEGR